MALACADGFLKAAHAFIDPLKIQQELPEGPNGTYGPAFGDLVVCATNLGFALELYLKCLHAQLGLRIPVGHDLWKLYEDLPSHIKAEIEDRYESGRTKPSPTHAAITLALSKTQSPPTWVDFNQLSMKLGDVLKRSKNLFVAWRYVFEFKYPEGADSRQTHTFEYLPLLFGCVAINPAFPG